MSSTTIRFLNRITLELDPHFSVEKNILEKGLWEPHVVALFDFLIPPETTALDIGANCGVLTLLMAEATKNGRVIAFEPNNLNIARLRNNIRLNPDLSDRILVRTEAVSDVSGTLRLYQSGDPEHLGNAYVASDFNSALWNQGSAEEFQECKSVRLDDLHITPAVGFIKADVEGGEAKIFEGAAALIKKDRPTIVFETLPTDFGNENVYKCEALLRRMGYELFSYSLLDGLLHPATFPCFISDTVALHSEKLSHYKEKISPVTTMELRDSIEK